MATKYELTTNELLMLQSEMRSREKSAGIAFLMLLAGHFGLHRFYLRRYVTGAVQLALFLTGFVFYILLAATAEFFPVLSIVSMVIMLVSFAALTIWVIVDLCLLMGMVKQFNQEIEQNLIAEIISLRP